MGPGPQPGPPATLDVARIVRPHGLDGTVVVERWTDLAERLAPGSVLESDAGTLTVASCRPQGKRFLVRFAGVTDRAGAESLRDLVLRAAPVVRPGVLWVHELLGCTVVTVAGLRLGVVAAVEANPASDLLVLDDGTLIPLTFVVDHVPGTLVRVDLPQGLVG